MLKQTVQQALTTSWTLFKIIIPFSIATKLLDEAGVTEILGVLLSPVMEQVGLPGSMGLVWAVAMVTNLYCAMVVFASLAPEISLTAAQVTVLTTMMLVAHALPVELRIAQKAGPRLRMMLFLRVGGAFVIGWILHRIYLYGGYLDHAATTLLVPMAVPAGWLPWALAEIKKLAMIFAIILFLILFMKAMDRMNITAGISKVLEPLLRLLGMSSHAVPITIIGITMGVSYGGGLIIQEAKSGNVLKHDIFYSLSLMGLFHAIVEDTLLMAAIGGHLSGILWARLIFSLVAIFLLVKLIKNISDATFDKYFFRTSVKDAK